MTVPSEYVRGSVIEAYGTDPSIVRVVPHGFDRTCCTTSVDAVELRRRVLPRRRT